MLALSLRNQTGRRCSSKPRKSISERRSREMRAAWRVNKREATGCPERTNARAWTVCARTGADDTSEDRTCTGRFYLTDDPPFSFEPEPTSTERVTCPECGSQEAVVVFTHFAYVACFCPDCDFSWSCTSSSSRFRATEPRG